MSAVRALRTLVMLTPMISLIAACSVEASEDGDMGDVGFTESSLAQGCSLTRSKIIASVSGGRKKAIERGFTWLDAKVPYSQSKSYKGYRTDCSGFVSMCWELGTSYTTAAFSTGGGESGPLGSFNALVPGDALVRRSGGSGHIVLFLGWNDAAKKSACVLEQASTKSDMQFGARTAASLKSGGFKAIAADKLANEVANAGGGNVEEDDDVAQIPPTPTPKPKPPANDNPTPPQGDDFPIGTECTNDGACNPGNNGSGLICEGGYCVDGCRQDNQCPGNFICIDGLCQ